MNRLILLALTVPTAAMAATPEEHSWSVKLNQGNTPALNSKPAEVYHLKENDNSSSAINAALSAAYHVAALDRATNQFSQTELLFGASIARNSLESKPQHVRAASAGIDTFWNARDKGSLAVRSTLLHSREEDRVKHTKGHTERLDLSLVRAVPAGNYDPGDFGTAVTAYPYAGYYRRRISKTDKPSTAPVGNTAGPFIGFFANIQVGKVTDDAEWLAPFSIEADAYRLKDGNVSGGYRRAYYKNASLGLNYALPTSPGSKWAPRISLVREVGTDRLSSKDYGRSTKLAFQVGYSLKPKSL